MFKMLSTFLSATLLSFTLFSCAWHQSSKNTLVLQYQAFGPPVVANQVIGMDWWQWQSYGGSRPQQYDIKVVVYKNIKLDQVKQIFPVKPMLKQDYRYIEYTEALAYLEQLIEENVIETLTPQLMQTKKTILNQMPQ